MSGTPLALRSDASILPQPSPRGSPSSSFHSWRDTGARVGEGDDPLPAVVDTVQAVLDASCQRAGVAAISRENVERIAAFATVVQVQRYANIWRRLGDSISSYFVVLSGRVAINGHSVTAGSGRSLSRVIGPRQDLGGGAWLPETMHLDEAVAIEPTELIAIRAEAMRAAPGLEELCDQLRDSAGRTYLMMMLTEGCVTARSSSQP